MCIILALFNFISLIVFFFFFYFFFYFWENWDFYSYYSLSSTSYIQFVRFTAIRVFLLFFFFIFSWFVKIVTARERVQAVRFIEWEERDIDNNLSVLWLGDDWFSEYILVVRVIWIIIELEGGGVWLCWYFTLFWEFYFFN